MGWWRQASRVGRVLDDGTSQITETTYNDQGSVLTRTDPLGRQSTYTYGANGVDLLTVHQTTSGMNDLLATYADFTALHQPQTSTDASGQSTTTTYNASGQILTVTNAKSEATTYVYDTDGRLTSVTGPVAGATTAYTYDDYGRVRTVTDADGYTVTTDYDAADRPVRVTYPNDTYEETVYDRLDIARTRDRLGRWTYLAHDALRRQVSTRDPAGRTIQQVWGPDGNLEALIDANGNATRWERDIQGRVTQEIRADDRATLYTYEDTTSRLASVTDAKEQVTSYSYDRVGAVTAIAFTNTEHTTPNVSFSYDATHGRLATMVDGTGTTTYAYHPVTDPPSLGSGLLATVDGPLTDDTLTYTYDELGRVLTRAVNGAANTVTWTYDALGRSMSEQNVLGTFGYTYDGTTGRVATVTYPNGQTSTYSYYGNQNDRRLQTIHHRYPNTDTLSQFDYTYDAVGNILTWRQQADNDAVLWEYGYDPADQLGAAVKKSTDPTPQVLQRFAYAYDPAGNRTLEEVDDAVTLSTHNDVNELVSQTPGGVLRFEGTLDEPGTVTIQGKPATVTAGNAFGGTAPVTSGTNTVTVAARDPSGNLRTNVYEVDLSGTGKAFTHDANGNLTADGARTFEWDARNQLVAVTVGTHRSEFTYDGRQRRVRAVEKENGVGQSDTKILWCSSAICEERAADGTSVTRRVFAEGEQIVGESRFFAADHLGSVTDVTDGSATVLGRYNFDAWGRRTVTAGTDVTRVGFTGHYTHSRAGLSLAWFRGYDSELGQWISDDPGGFVDGPNLHAYVRNNPTGFVDPDGRLAQALPIIVICSPDPVTKGALIAAAIAAGVVVIWKACEDGNCFGDKEREDDRNRRCETQYAADSEVCRRVKKRSCWAQAAERYSACLAGRPIPPFNF